MLQVNNAQASSGFSFLLNVFVGFADCLTDDLCFILSCR